MGNKQSDTVKKMVNKIKDEIKHNIQDDIKDEIKYDIQDDSNANSQEEFIYDDIQEVCVTGGDKRLQIYNTGRKKDAIIQCIGQLRTTYHYSIGGGYGTGTGTIFHVMGNQCFILTCAHNIRTNVYYCRQNQCGGKMLYKTNCNKCGGQVVKKYQLHNAVRVTFVRRSITKGTFGEHEEEYECDMSKCVINDKQYSKHPHPTSGFDIAILVINDKQAADYYRDKCQNIFLVNNCELFLSDKRQMHLFGYPGDKSNAEEMWGMSTPMQNELKLEINDEQMNLYVINQQIDTANGQSGSCIYCHGDNVETFWICSVHTGGSKAKRQNYATLMSVATLKWIQQNIGVNI
eukprot:430992_1